MATLASSSGKATRKVTPVAQATARLESRVTPEVKELVQRAADLEGRTVTDFVTTSALEAAYRVIEQHQVLRLNREDSAAFVEAVLHPPEPNEALQAAAQRYQQLMSD
jgi:uncharacterized protein (DUF1778 family)